MRRLVKEMILEEVSNSYNAVSKIKFRRTNTDMFFAIVEMDERMSVEQDFESEIRIQYKVPITIGWTDLDSMRQRFNELLTLARNGTVKTVVRNWTEQEGPWYIDILGDVCHTE